MATVPAESNRSVFNASNNVNNGFDFNYKHMNTSESNSEALSANAKPLFLPHTSLPEMEPLPGKTYTDTGFEICEAVNQKILTDAQY